MRSGSMLLLFVLFFWVPFFASGQRCADILWSKHHHLKWKNFKARPDKTSSASALTASNISQEFSVTGNVARFHFSSSFSPCRSWVKSKDANLLMHEQTHFDLTEYYKRLLVKEILDQNFSVRDITLRANGINARLNRLREEANDLYDKETNHSINDRKQKQWTKRVRKMIRKLRHYDTSDYTLTLTGR